MTGDHDDDDDADDDVCCGQNLKSLRTAFRMSTLKRTKPVSVVIIRLNLKRSQIKLIIHN